VLIISVVLISLVTGSHFQQGWRLGGKGASGRGIHDRIEEHGVHV